MITEKQSRSAGNYKWPLVGGILFLVLFVLDCVYSKYNGIHYLFNDMKTCLPYLILSAAFDIAKRKEQSAEKMSAVRCFCR